MCNARRDNALSSDGAWHFGRFAAQGEIKWPTTDTTQSWWAPAAHRVDAPLTSMRVHLGSDHAGFELKQQIAERLRRMGHDVVDHGSHQYQPDDDYPPFCLRAARAVVAEPGSLCVVLGGSGNGEQIAANKVRGVRAALGWSTETAKLARQHNDANVLSIGARMHTADEAMAFVDAFVAEPFSGDERHARRIAMLAAYERDGVVPP